MIVAVHSLKQVRYRSVAIALMLTFASVACKPTISAETAAKAAEPAPVAQNASAVVPAVSAPGSATSSATSSAFVEPAIKSVLPEGMAYASLRKTLLDAGWLPLRDPMCWENVGGEAAVCYQLPEVESCSGDGRCAMRFANEKDGATVRVTTYGDYRRWNRSGEESAFPVKSVSFAPVATVSASPACPARQFDAFLKAFASDRAVQRGFTAALVRVAEIGGGEDGDDAVPVYMQGADYAGFNVEHSGGAFHFVNEKGNKDASALELKIEERDQGVRGVEYRYGMSEGNSYIFEEIEGCWYLTEDPQPPSP